MSALTQFGMSLLFDWLLVYFFTGYRLSGPFYDMLMQKFDRTHSGLILHFSWL